MQFPCKLQRQWGNEVKDGETDGGRAGAACLEVGARVGLGRRMVRLQGALEGTAATDAAARLQFLGAAVVELAGTGAVIDQVLAVLLVLSALAETPDQQGNNGQDNGTSNANQPTCIRRV